MAVAEFRGALDTARAAGAAALATPASLEAGQAVEVAQGRTRHPCVSFPSWGRWLRGVRRGAPGVTLGAREESAGQTRAGGASREQTRPWETAAA